MDLNFRSPIRRLVNVIDPFTIAMTVAIVIAAFLPATGRAGLIFDRISSASIAILFFSHGAAVSFSQTLEGLRHWRLHLLIFVTTFVVFPIVVLPLRLLPAELLPADLFLGFLYLAALPSAVSGSIAFTAMAEGNVPGAVCASATSNTLGLMITPLIVAITMGSRTAATFDLVHALRGVVLQLLLPFALGQLISPRVRMLTERHGNLLRFYDQSVIVFVVYVAFSQSIADDLWQRLPFSTLCAAVIICVALMLIVVVFDQSVARRLGFSRRDEIAAVFCGSKKSLASGLPLAKVLFAHSSSFGMIIVPIMIYNQTQNLIGAVLAKRYADRHPSGEAQAPIDDRRRSLRRQSTVKNQHEVVGGLGDRQPPLF